MPENFPGPWFTNIFVISEIFNLYFFKNFTIVTASLSKFALLFGATLV